MTQPHLPSVPPPPSVPKSSHRNRNTGIAALVIGLAIGLALGIFISPILLPKQTGTGTNNQVQVSVVIQATDPSEGYPRHWGLTFDRARAHNSYKLFSVSYNFSANAKADSKKTDRKYSARACP